MKNCSKCHTDKPTTEYFMKNSKTGLLHAQCKECYRTSRKQTYAKHYEKYKEVYRERAKKRHQEQREKFRQNILAYLKDKACKSCGESDVRVLEFDHLDPYQKGFTISQAVKLNKSWDNVLTEIKKCQILCANCHRKRTCSQADWYKK